MPQHCGKKARIQRCVKMAGMLMLLLLLAVQVRAQSALDGFDPNANGAVRVVVVQPDGRILIGGEFTALAPNGGASVTRNSIARLNPDGTLDTTFNPNVSSPGSSVFAIALQADGKILVGGNFTRIGGQPRFNIARLDATTGLADSFNPNANGHVRSIAVQTDGKVLAGGFFTGIGGQSRNRIARLDATTGLADSFNPDASEIVYSIVVQPDGKILAGGMFDNIGGQQRHKIARLAAATGAADSLDPDASGAVFSIAIQADGKILAGGNFTDIGGTARYRIGRFDPTTGLADSFNAVVVSGEVNSIAVQADGKILAAGSFGGANSISGQTRNRIARLEADGRVDQTLNTFINGSYVDAIAVQPDGKTLIGGSFSMVSGAHRGNLARLNSDGTLDAAFIPATNDQILSVAVQTDGKILAAGYLFANPGVVGITRLDATTGMKDPSFHPATNNFVGSMALQPDGKILITGGFSSSPDKSITRLNLDGSVDTSFDPRVTGGALCVAVEADGKILVGGFFNSVGGQTRNYIARLNPDGTLDAAFNPNPDDLVSAIAVQADGKVLVAGGFSSIGGQTRHNIARLDATTGLADSFDPNSNGSISSIAIQADGKIVVGGFFESIGGQMRNHVARLDPTTGLADSFDPNTYGYVHSLAVSADGKILVGGGFGSVGGQQRYDFARLSNDTAALQNLAVTRTAISWTRGGSSAQFAHVTFESSTDNVNYSLLGNGTRAGSTWILNGLSLPTEQNTFIRARGYYGAGQENGSGSLMESVRSAFIPRPSTLGNISTRVRIQAGDNAMIGGFIIAGTEPKTVIVRGIGPSLSIPGALADPVIEVHGSAGQLLATNDNWNDSLTRQQIIDSGLAPTNDLESALWGIIDPGAYTVVVRGKNNATGIGLFEVYDLDRTVDSKLANVSTRGFVETGDNVMIGGTIIVGIPRARVLLRAIGPSLTNFGVSNALGDPSLELYDSNGSLIAANHDWRDDQEAEIIATGIAPSNNLESAIVRDLFPGNYTAIVRGANNATGVALVEAYELN